MAKWGETEWEGVKYDVEGYYADTKHDPVQKPAHYNQNGMECIEAIEALISSIDKRYGYHAGITLKYLWRFEDKNGLEDLEKAKWYLDRLIEKYKEVHK